MIIARPSDDAFEQSREGAARRHLFGAKGATFIPSLGQCPREIRRCRPSALKARFIRALSRAFSARSLGNLRPWGVVPGCDESALSALSGHMRDRAWSF
jgi:hypothetical protein